MVIRILEWIVWVLTIARTHSDLLELWKSIRVFVFSWQEAGVLAFAICKRVYHMAAYLDYFSSTSRLCPRRMSISQSIMI